METMRLRAKHSQLTIGNFSIRINFGDGVGNFDVCICLPASIALRAAVRYCSTNSATSSVSIARGVEAATISPVVKITCPLVTARLVEEGGGAPPGW